MRKTVTLTALLVFSLYVDYTGTSTDDRQMFAVPAQQTEWYYPHWISSSPYVPEFNVLDTESNLAYTGHRPAGTR